MVRDRYYTSVKEYYQIERQSLGKCCALEVVKRYGLENSLARACGKLREKVRSIENEGMAPLDEAQKSQLPVEKQTKDFWVFTGNDERGVSFRILFEYQSSSMIYLHGVRVLAD